MATDRKIKLINPLTWRPAYRIINSRFPFYDPFVQLSEDPRDLDILKQLDDDGNERVRMERGDVPPPTGVTLVRGPGASLLNSPLAHHKTRPGRFAGPGDRVVYMARLLETAIAETRHHQEARLQLSQDPPQALEMRVYQYDVTAVVHDVRSLRKSRPEIYHPTDYAASIALGAELRRIGETDGILYESVRHPGGECLVLHKLAYTAPVQTMHLQYTWNGKAIDRVIEMRLVPGASNAGG